LQAHARRLYDEFPKKFEMDTTQGGFPIIRILDSVVSQEISSLVIDDALAGGLPSLRLCVLPLPVREAAHCFIAQREFSAKDHDLIYAPCAGMTIWKGILLLRGLLMDGEGILGYVLKERRWRVVYGLDPSRTLLAVPYRAKVCLIDLVAELLLIKIVYLLGASKRGREREGMCKRDDLCNGTQFGSGSTH
jgi:hypothetical protein